MKPWLRLLIITLTVGGGFTGFSATLQSLLKAPNANPGSALFALAFLALYAFVTASGLSFALNPDHTTPLFAAFGLQVPWISSPLCSLRFTAGFHITVGVVGGHVQGGFNFGSDWKCSVFQKAEFGGGVNLFALLILVLLANSSPARDAPSVPNDSGPVNEASETVD